MLLCLFIYLYFFIQMWDLTTALEMMNKTDTGQFLILYAKLSLIFFHFQLIVNSSVNLNDSGRWLVLKQQNN